MAGIALNDPACHRPPGSLYGQALGRLITGPVRPGRAQSICQMESDQTHNELRNPAEMPLEWLFCKQWGVPEPDSFMKINKLVLKNIRCFRELTLELNGESAVLVGDNGDGKSTVLRSLAMGLVDDSSSAALFRELYGGSVQDGRRSGAIEVEFTNGGKAFRTQVEIISGMDDLERVNHRLYEVHQGGEESDVDQEKFSWGDLFAVGYGAGVRVHGTEDYDEYFATDALHPLFVYRTRLQNPELVMRRLISTEDGLTIAEGSLKKLKTLLARLLQLESADTVALTREGIKLDIGHGPFVLTSVGDGYHATVTWVLDMLYWWYLHGSNGLTDINGIVIIDEIEQHLHPRWQRNIVRLLTECFPSVQFVLSTHSPLVASGCEGVPVHCLKSGGTSRKERPFGWRAEEVYDMMGLESTRAAGFVDYLEEFHTLDDKNVRSGGLRGEEARQYGHLKNLLEKVPGSDPVRLLAQLETLERLAKEPSGPGA